MGGHASMPRHIKLGQTYSSKIFDGSDKASDLLPAREGTVVYIDPKRCYFTVAFPLPKGTIRESFPMIDSRKIPDPVKEPRFGGYRHFKELK